MAGPANKGLIFALGFLLQFIVLATPFQAAARVVRVGIFPAPPLVISDTAKPSGFFIELIEYFAQNLDWQVEYFPDTWSNSLEKLNKGEIDLLPAISYTEDRELHYDFSKHVVYIDSGVVFTGSGFQPHTVFDLQGKHVAAVEGSIFTARFIDFIASFGVESEILFTNNNREVMEAIVSGKADAGVSIYSLGNELAKEYPVNITAISFSPMALEFAVPEDKNQDLLDGINRLMAEMIDDPDSFYSRSFRKWTMPDVKKEIPPWIWGGLTGLLSLGLILIVLNMFLRRQVNLKTKDLQLEITNKEKIAKALDAEKERLDTTLRSIGDGVITTDHNGNILLINKVAESLTGWHSSEATGLPLPEVFNIVEETGHESSGTPMEKALKSGEPIEITQVFLIAKDGKELLIDYSCAPIRQPDNNVIGVILVFQDTTEVKKMEHQLQQAQKMEAIGTLAGGIAHDFNNILSSIIGFTELALENQTETNSTREYLLEVLAAGHRAKELSSQILSISRHDKVEIVPVSLNQTMENAFRMLRSIIPASTDFKGHICDEQLTVEADAGQLNQVILNLVTNALHAMFENGGSLEISVSSINFDEDIENIYPDITPGNYAHITISDTGEGIKPKHMEKIFEPYFTTKKKGVGTGLGLFMVHGIVKSYKGHISVYSEVGKGTIFHIYLPLSDSKAEPGKASEIEQQGGHERILLIDDEPSIVKMQESSLGQLGYVVTSSTNSLEALGMFEADPEQFDLIITDMTMPKLTGDKLAHAAKKIRPDIPIILCTGFSEKIDGTKGDSAIDMILLKPVEKIKMAKTIRTALALRN